jgi:hypothetical protein
MINWEWMNIIRKIVKKIRNPCKSVTLKHIYFRLISKDFFTMENMFKYKMVKYNNRCKRCGEVKHIGTYFGNAKNQKNL